MTLLILLGSSLVAAAISFLIRKKTLWLEIIAVLAGTLELIAGIIIVMKVSNGGNYLFGSIFAIDPLGAVVMLTVTIVGFAASIYSVGYLREEVSKQIIDFKKVKQYFVLFHLFLASMFLANATVNPIIMWIAIEATTLSTAFLISFYNKGTVMEAAWKYLIINSIGLLLGFFGTLLFLTTKTPSSVLMDWQSLLLNAQNLNPLITKIAFIFILIGYGTKIGFAPMHTWKPDVYSKTPTPIVALFSGSLLNVVFLAVLRFKSISDAAIGPEFSRTLLLFFGLLSIIISAFIIFIQKSYKRLLAYSSIEHAGIIALGFGFGGIASFGAILHMIYHSLAKSTLFFSSGNILLKYGSTKIVNIKGVLSSLPVTGIIFLLGFLAATGIPPFGIFITEVTIFSAGIISHPYISFIAILLLALIFIGFLRHVVAMTFGESPDHLKKGEYNYMTIIPSIILMTLLIITSIYLPTSIKSLIDAAAAFTH